MMGLISASDIKVKGQCLIDSEGNTRFFHGINLVYKGHQNPDGSYHFYPPSGKWNQDLYHDFRKRGFNIVRLGIIWAALEPTPGQYDDSYLAFITAQLEMAAQAGISVVLDMHQDLYAQRFGDGAPDWAVLTDQPFDHDGYWSDAYITSEAVQESWDAFWNNAVVPESGQGVQDHYIALWQHIARHMAGRPGLLGYDILNEPTPGSEMPLIFAQLMERLALILTPERMAAIGLDEQLPPEAIFMNPELKLRALQLLDDPEIFAELTQGTESLATTFDETKLWPFCNRVAEAIRSEDSYTLLVRPTCYLANIGVTTNPRAIEVSGIKDERQMYSAHGYDLVVDTEAMLYASDARAGFIFQRHREMQRQMDFPCFAGEWGGLAHFDMPGHADYHMNLFTTYGWSSAYWWWTDDFADTPAATILNRPTLQALKGHVKHFAYDSVQGTLDMTISEGPTVLRVPSAPVNVTFDDEVVDPDVNEVDGVYYMEVPEGISVVAASFTPLRLRDSE